MLGSGPVELRVLKGRQADDVVADTKRKLRLRDRCPASMLLIEVMGQDSRAILGCVLGRFAARLLGNHEGVEACPSWFFPTRS